MGIKLSLKALISFALLFFMSLDAKAQVNPKSLVERLGYPPDAKLLIVHADDLGMAHSVNAASIKAFESGLVNSGSIMVPCPWFPEIAEYARAHSDADLGLHLTLTSEWAVYLWGPVLSKERAPTLFDKRGYLYPTEAVAALNINPKEAEAEIRAQIERARAYGINPTHLDSHMGTLYQSKDLFEMFLRVAREERLPARISKDFLGALPFFSSVIRPDDILIDKIVTIGSGVTSERWVDYYIEEIKKMQPGVNELVIHLAFDDAEMRAVTVNHPDWGAAWRQRDYDFFTSDRFRQLLKDQNIKLITWREVGKLMRSDAK
jgi:predicted glycoside hydrolase/deacetylase ChbG (UPF0249 family)